MSFDSLAAANGEQSHTLLVFFCFLLKDFFAVFILCYMYCYICVCVCVHIQVHLNKLECRGKVHLFQ